MIVYFALKNCFIFSFAKLKFNLLQLKPEFILFLVQTPNPNMQPKTRPRSTGVKPWKLSFNSNFKLKITNLIIEDQKRNKPNQTQMYPLNKRCS